MPAALGANGNIKADVRDLLGTAWLSPATAGTPDVNVKFISGDSTAADNAESFFDGTGFGVHQLRTTINSVTSQTSFVLNAGPETDNSLRGSTIIFRNATMGEDMGPAYSQRTITGYNYDSAVRTVTIDSAPDFTIAGGDTVEIVPPGFAYADRTAAATAQTKIGFLPSATAGATGGVAIVGSNMGSVTGISGVTFPANFSTLTIADNAVAANVTRWLDTGVTVNVAGVPKVDITHVQGEEASAVSGAIDVNVVKLIGNEIELTPP